MKKLLSLLALMTFISLIIFFQSCSEDYKNPAEPNTNEASIVLRSNTKEVEKNPNFISVSVDSEQVILTYNNSNNFPDIKVGDIIMGNTGEGYLRKVNSIGSQGNSLILLTTNASLEEAFSKIKIDTSFSLIPIAQKIKPINYKKTIRENGSTLEISATSGKPSLAVNTETGQTHLEFPNLIFRIIKPDQSGIFELTAQNVIIDISATIHKVVIDEDENGVHQFSLIYRVENTQVFNNVSMYLKGGINEQFPDLLHEDLLPSDLFIGSAAFGPIILTFYLNIAGGIHGQFWMQAGTNLVANMNSTSTYDVGAEYRNGNWSVVWEKSTEGNTTVDFTPIASITGNAKLFIKPKFKVKVFDIFGPTLFVRGFIYGEFNYPPIHLAVGPGFDGGLSFDVSFLTFKIASFQAILVEKKWIWWESQGYLPCLGISTVSYTGKTYNTVEIGDQCWIKENLDVGVMIPGSQDQGNNSVIEKYCYNNDPNNCYIYGGLYQWNEAMKYSTSPGTQGICPLGWHIPTLTEFEILKAAVNSDGNALKAIGQGSGGGSGTNTSGFSALLAGYRTYIGPFFDLGHFATFWSSAEEYDATYAGILYMYYEDSIVGQGGSHKVTGNSVRCLKD
jgi:uncharacterized protein (TIGR02145 family)